MSVKTIQIKGMSCQHCVKAVTEALTALDGLKNVSVDLTAGTASFEEAKPVTVQDLKDAIARVGFEPGDFVA